jgi:L-ribulokinase
MLGMTLATRPEEIYRALVEATAYGTRKIIKTFENSGIAVDEFYAAGGISRNPVVMQIYADVIKKPVKIAGSPQAPALGSAIFGAVAAGRAVGGHDTIEEAARAMGKLLDVVYQPRTGEAHVYDKLYREYTILHDYFGRGVNNVLKSLKDIRKSIKGA